MIITRIIGGLGNQMFQYAAGKSLATHLNTDFKIDISAYKNQNPKDTSRDYEIGCFSISDDFADQKDLEIFSYLKKFPFKYSPKLQYIYEKLSGRSIYREKNPNIFQSNFFDLSGNIYLLGDWQSEKYFKNIENIIKNDFKFKNDLNKNFQRYLREIKKTNSISIHSRRTDYITNPHANRLHGVCPISYYQKAIKLIKAKIKNPHFYIFSDDITWCKNNLKLRCPATYVEKNKAWEDLQLMSNCKHNIIANSSFSWWGAWLNPAHHKIVYAPKKWFVGIRGNTTKDRIPKKWIRI